MASSKLYPLLPRAVLPTFRNGVWNKPKLTARQWAAVKRETLLQGKVWPYQHIEAAIKMDKAVVPPPPKGHKYDRLQEERRAKIQANLDGMDAKMAKKDKVFGKRELDKIKRKEDILSNFPGREPRRKEPLFRIGNLS
eukprot:TRINITY_DN545_c0_g2_i8.p1 TRINITY_DN545_c0_g2~~TRINITY_DN545_c0_g2_i8.p1  ORF type:complete len:138 (-),score=22.18 TRINITY_DN545_c0_g2_i8:129-542(-)